MIIIGGIKSVAGPIIGAIAFITLQEWLSAYTDRWQVVLGPLLVLLVLFAREGIVGLVEKLGKARG
jgi:branched-chain amino acid transport system permease protein